jgi:hypothetical protein
VLFVTANAQVDTAWVRTIDNETHALDAPAACIAIPDGGVVVTGLSVFNGAILREEMLTVRYDASGNRLWQNRYFGSSGLGANAYRVVQATDGGFVVAGKTLYAFDIVLPAVVKYSADGSREWAVEFDDPTIAGVEAWGLASGQSGDIYISGPGRDSGFVAAFTSAGIKRFARKIASSGSHLMVDKTGAVYAVGARTPQEAVDSLHPGHVCVTKFLSDGTLLWSTDVEWNGVPNYTVERAALDAMGNVVIAGDVWFLDWPRRATYWDVACASVSADGAVRWQHVYDGGYGSWHNEDHILDMAVTSDAGVLLISKGQTDVDSMEFVISKYRNDGSLEWRRRTLRWVVTEPGIIAMDPSGDFYVTSALSQLILDCYSSGGSLKWTSQFAFGRHQAPTSVALTSDHRLYISEAVDFPGGGLNYDYATLACYLPSPLSIDILPGSCPNILSVGLHDINIRDLHPGPASVGQPTVSVAIVGTKAFDVARVDPSTLNLAGIAPSGYRIADVSRPVEPRESDCDCNKLGGDGIPDLVLNFNQASLVAVLSPYSEGEIKTLTVAGQTKTGVPLTGSDCVTITSQPIHVGLLAGADEQIPSGLSDCYPNPFNAATTIAFSLASDEYVRLEVYNVLGQRVATLVDATLPPGPHVAVWDARGVASGVYFARLTMVSGVQTKKLALVR